MHDFGMIRDDISILEKKDTLTQEDFLGIVEDLDKLFSIKNLPVDNIDILSERLSLYGNVFIGMMRKNKDILNEASSADSLITKKELLEKRLEELEHTKEKLKSEKEELRNTEEEIRKKESLIIAEKDELNVKREALIEKSRELEEAENECKEIEKEIVRLRERSNTDLAEKKSSLEKERERVLNTINSDELLIKRLQDSIDNCERNIEQIKAQNSEKQIKKIDLENEIRRLQNSVLGIDEEINSNQKKVDSLKERYVARELELKEISDKYTYYQIQLEELNRKNVEVIEREEHLPYIQKKTAEMRVALEEKEKSISIEEKAQSDKKNELNEVLEQLNNRQAEIEKIKNDNILLEQEIANLKSLSEGNYFENRERLLSEKKLLEDKISDTNRQLKELSGEVEQLREKLSDNNKEISDSGLLHEKLKLEKAEKEKSVIEANDRVQQLQRDIAAVENEIEVLLQNEKAVQKQLNELQDQKDDKIELIKKKEKQLAGDREDFNEGFCKESDKNLTALEKRIQIIENACNQIKEEFTLDGSQNNSVNYIETAIKSMRNQLANLVGAYKEIINSLDLNNR